MDVLSENETGAGVFRRHDVEKKDVRLTIVLKGETKVVDR